jgi:hypothetical protein
MGAVAFAPIAMADTQGSLNDKDGSAFAMELWPDGEYETSDQATGLAYSVCQQRGIGWSEEDLIHKLGVKYSISLSVDVVVGAEFHFCPGYAINTSPDLGPVGRPLWSSEGYGPSNPYGPPYLAPQLNRAV